MRASPVYFDEGSRRYLSFKRLRFNYRNRRGADFGKSVADGYYGQGKDSHRAVQWRSSANG